MSIEKTKAISLGSIRLGETSEIVTFLTHDFGLVKCVAKGSKSKRSKFGAALEPGNLSAIVFYYRPRRDLFMLSQADTLQFFPKTRVELLKSAYQQVPLELCRQILLPAAREKGVFDLAEDFLFRLEEANGEGCYAALALRFLAFLCEGLGFAPKLEKCHACGAQIGDMFFNLKKGTLSCARCRKDAGGRLIEKESFRLLANLFREDPIPEAAHGDTLGLLRLLSDYLSCHLDRPLRLVSLAFVKSLKNH